MRLNKGMVTRDEVGEQHGAAELRTLIERHHEATASPLAARILSHFDEYLPYFKKITPTDYSRMLVLIGQFEEKGLSREQAEIDAFYAMQKA